MEELRPRETSEFVDAGEQRLYSMIHFPDSNAPATAWVFCHPFAEEKLWSHRAFVRFARLLAHSGAVAARFDMRGYGDSDGEFKIMTLRQQLDDVQVMVRHLQQTLPSVDRIGLLGLRLGGSIALLAAAENPAVSEVVLWDPVIDGGRYMQEIMRANLAAQMATQGQVEITREQLVEQMQGGTPVNIEGYPLTYRYFSDISALNLMDCDLAGVSRGLAVEIVRNPKQPIGKMLRQFDDGFDQFTVEKAHEQQFWREIKEFYSSADNLYSTSLEWLDLS